LNAWRCEAVISVWGKFWGFATPPQLLDFPGWQTYLASKSGGVPSGVELEDDGVNGGLVWFADVAEIAELLFKYRRDE
jgi:hypothetical protein